MIEKWNQSVSTIHQTKQDSQMQCRNYLRALVVTLND